MKKTTTQTIETNEGLVTIEVSQDGWHVVEGGEIACNLPKDERVELCQIADVTVEAFKRNALAPQREAVTV